MPSCMSLGAVWCPKQCPGGSPVGHRAAGGMVRDGPDAGLRLQPRGRLPDVHHLRPEGQSQGERFGWMQAGTNKKINVQ